jgi:hypothetical protein
VNFQSVPGLSPGLSQSVPGLSVSPGYPSTSAREALVRGFEVHIDPEATGARDLHDDVLGSQSADEVRRSSLLQLLNMGAYLVSSDSLVGLVPAVTHA